MYCRVAVNYPVKNQGLTYLAPEELGLAVGNIVDVPLGKRRELGCVMELHDTAPTVEAKAVLAKREDYPTLRPNDLRLFQWMSDYYHYGLGQLIADSLPAAKKRPRPLKESRGTGLPLEHSPSIAQQNVIGEIISQLGKFSKHLVHGVTGSGKTLIFQEAMRQVFERGQSVLYLLPEINLTPQFVDTFRRHVNVSVLTFHSEVTASEKFLIWKMAADSAEPRLYLGVRSAVFLPINNLGLIVIDEEHDGSFKQDDRCPYNARDVAMKKAQIEGCPIVLASATPAMETWFNFTQSNSGAFYHPLPERVAGAFLPKIRFVDTRKPVKPSLESPPEPIWPLVPSTVELLRSATQRGEQALVFINRLGFANYLQCRSCGHQFHCPNCSVTLRYFKQKNLLSCQHCEYSEPLPESCPKCFCLTLQQKGFGTERVQHELQHLIPEKTIERFDRDEIKTFTALKDKLERFHEGKIDLLVGTQMLSKGHNFKRVKKVLILGVDNQLNYPDFRATERVWQTIVQVAGRAGRYSQDGEVFIQTGNPEAPLFDIIARQSLDEFYKAELPLRELCECPPFYRLAALYFSGRFQDKLIQHMTQVIDPLFRGLTQKHFKQVQVLGPRPATIEKKANQFTWTILLKSRDLNELHNCLNSFQLNWAGISGISLKIDVDPQHLV